MVAFSGGGAADAMSALPPDKRDATYAEELQKRYPNYAENFVMSRFMDWPATPWTRELFLRRARRGDDHGPDSPQRHRRPATFCRRATCYKFAGYMEGALNSGLSVARRLAVRDGIVAGGG